MHIEWNRVTTLSKLVALILFVSLPFIGFWYGIKFGQLLDQAYPPTASTTTVVSGSGAVPEYYQNVSEWQTNRDDQGGFSIAYPLDFDTQTAIGGGGLTMGIYNVPGTIAPPRFILHIPRAFEPQTNFVEAVLSVSVSKDALVVKDCLAKSDQPDRASFSNETINGISFLVAQSSGAGAGNYYQGSSYRALNKGRCYSMDYFMHSAAIGNYPAEYHLREFDATKARDVLDRIVGTFKFL